MTSTPQQTSPQEEPSIKEVIQKEGKFPAILLFVSAGILIFLDQWTKSWAVKTLFLGTSLPISPRELYTKKIEVFSWWNYQLVGNKGAAWGMFGNLPDSIRLPFFTLIGVIAVVGIFVFYYRSYQQFLMRISLISIFAGAIGNIIDRMTIGYVIDFIDWHYNGYHWPTFNVADIAISVGVGLMLVQMILESIYPSAVSVDNSETNKA